MSWALHFSLAPTLFEPAETAGLITPFIMLYALHDALVKPMPERAMAPSLAESWSASRDGLVYEFVLRKGATFHKGEPVTAEDVKFSFDRYRGISARVFKEKVAAISGGAFAYGGYPDIDGLFKEQAGELDPKKREAILPIWQLALLQGVGPRVAESGLGLIADYPWSAPYEDLKLKGK